MVQQEFTRTYAIHGRDFTNAGRASTSITDILKEMGIRSSLVRRLASAAYEAEMNVVMHAVCGTLTLRVTPAVISIQVEDNGPGIEDIVLAMQEGYSTATQEMKELGFGAGMGLPNIQKNSDEFDIASEVGRGTRLSIRVNLA
jgi:anti-sigma regulatory factor (Ser/Thr protein kinase)